MLGQACGAIFFPPFSEALGRRLVFIISTALYTISCGFVAIPDIRAVYIGRFFSGALSAVPTVVVAGSIEDIWNSRERIWVVFAWEVVAIIGLVVGPIMGTYVTTSSLGWYRSKHRSPFLGEMLILNRKWIFYIAVMIMGCTFGLSLGMHESRPSQVLKRKVRAIHETTGYNLRFKNPDPAPSLQSIVTTALARPLRLFFTEPIVFLVAVMSSFVFALIYLFAEAFPTIYSLAPHNFDERQSSLALIPLAVGLIFGVPLRLYDLHTDSVRSRLNRAPVPEDKLVGFYVAAPILAAGLWWFAWTIGPLVRIHWIASMVALLLIGFCTNEFDTVLSGYLTDTYRTYAASANAPSAVLRALLSAAFPLFGRSMFRRLGSNVATSILAGLATAFCVTPFIFKRYGERIRLAGKFARSSSDADEKEFNARAV